MRCTYVRVFASVNGIEGGGYSMGGDGEVWSYLMGRDGEGWSYLMERDGEGWSYLMGGGVEESKSDRCMI